MKRSLMAPFYLLERRRRKWPPSTFWRGLCTFIFVHGAPPKSTWMTISAWRAGATSLRDGFFGKYKASRLGGFLF